MKHSARRCPNRWWMLPWWKHGLPCEQVLPWGGLGYDYGEDPR